MLADLHSVWPQLTGPALLRAHLWALWGTGLPSGNTGAGGGLTNGQPAG